LKFTAIFWNVLIAPKCPDNIELWKYFSSISLKEAGTTNQHF
jgi:hypothetical protein